MAWHSLGGSIFLAYFLDKSFRRYRPCDCDTSNHINCRKCYTKRRNAMDKLYILHSPLSLLPVTYMIGLWNERDVRERESKTALLFSLECKQHVIFLESVAFTIISPVAVTKIWWKFLLSFSLRFRFNILPIRLQTEWHQESKNNHYCFRSTCSLG